MSLNFSFPFVSTPAFYTGTPVSNLVPDVFPVGINGRPYMLDLASNQFTRQFEPRVRDSVDQSTAPGEAAINPGGLWRRGEVSWHLGAGQKYADTADAVDFRFWKSKGINPWTKGQLTLHQATKISHSSSATEQHMVVQDGRIYASFGADVKYTTDPFTGSPPTWNDCTGEPGGDCKAMATDGYKIYLAFPNDGVRQIIPNTSISAISGTKYVNSTDSYYMLGFAKQFMFGAYDHVLHTIASGGSKTDRITPDDTQFRWVGVATGQTAAYAAGYSGKKSLIYKMTIGTTGTLDAGSVALELPTGEVVSTISGYLGFILLGTNKGVRFCTADSSGNLIAGQLIATSGSVKKFASNDRFSYFTWTNYDGTSGGLGRLDLSNFTNPNTPSYATDLMYDSTAEVTNVVLFDNGSVTRPVFMISGVGAIAEDPANLVTSGTIDTGIYRWGIADRKFVAFIDTRALPLNGSIASYYSLDGADYQLAGTWDEESSTENSFSGSDDHAIEASFRFTLNRDTATTGPTFTRWMARAYAAPFRSEIFTMPLLIHSMIRVFDKEYYFDVDEELTILRRLIARPQVVTLQIREETISAIIEDMVFQALDGKDKDWLWQGTATVTMRSVQE